MLQDVNLLAGAIRLTDQTPFEAEIAKLIVNTLHLKIPAESIKPEEPLFGDGLGLDSIDALELAMVISQTYGYKLRSDDPESKTIFASLRALATAIEKHRAL